MRQKHELVMWSLFINSTTPLFLKYIPFFYNFHFMVFSLKSPLILHASCMSFGMIVTHFAWIAQMFTCSRSPTKNASPASCKASTAELCSFNPSLHFCTISLTSLWKGTLLIRRSAPFWYFWISFRACIPHCIFLCFSTFSSLMIFNCLSFLSLIRLALFSISSLSFCMSAIFLSPASLALSFFTFSLETFTVLAISNNGRWY